MTAYVHGSAVIFGESAILVRGASGAGKSSLVLALLDQATLSGHFARLVGDDRVALGVHSGRLVVRAHLQTAGQVEQRGIGILRLKHEPAAIVRFIVDLVAEPVARMPAATERQVDLCGIRLPRLVLNRSLPVHDMACRVAAAMALAYSPE